MNQSIELLPYRLTERCFRKYENVIAEIVAKAPYGFPLKPFENVNTFVARLRDAMTSFEKFAWKSEIDHNYFKILYPEVKITHTEHGPQVMYSVNLLVQAEAETKAAEPSMKNTFNFTNPTRQELHLMARLCHERMINGEIVINGLHVDDSIEIEENFDVQLDQLPDGTWRMV